MAVINAFSRFRLRRRKSLPKNRRSLQQLFRLRRMLKKFTIIQKWVPEAAQKEMTMYQRTAGTQLMILAE